MADPNLKTFGHEQRNCCYNAPAHLGTKIKPTMSTITNNKMINKSRLYCDLVVII